MIGEMVKAAQGNPGAVQVLVEISKRRPTILAQLILSLEKTNSKSYGLWLVYKDMFSGDIEKTATYLKNWMSIDEAVPLEKYVETALAARREEA